MLFLIVNVLSDFNYSIPLAAAAIQPKELQQKSTFSHIVGHFVREIYVNQ